MRIAIVILNWNGQKLLEQFLPSVVNFSSQEADIYLADNASTDSSINYVRAFFPSIKIVENAINGGYAKGYNDALKSIDADIYCLLNSDIEVTKNWLKPIIEVFKVDEKVAIIQPKILDFKDKTKFEYAGAGGGFIDLYGYPYCRGRVFNHLETDKGQFNDVKDIFWASGACLFIRSQVYHTLKGFDEDYFAHQEEIDLCWRLKNKGFKVMVEPKSVVYHVGGGTLNAGSPFKTYLNFRNNLFMLFKNLPISSLFTTIPMRLVLDGVAALTFLNKEKGLEHVLAIAKAHFSFYFAIPNLIAKRQKISQKNSLVGKMNWSILVKNKMNGIKQFSEL